MGHSDPDFSDQLYSFIYLPNILADLPQKSKNSHHGLPNPNNHSDLSDHPFRLQPLDNFTETTTLTSFTTFTTFATNNTIGFEYGSLNSTIT